MGFVIDVAQEDPKLTDRRCVLEGIDTVIPRIGVSLTDHGGTALLRRIERTGVYALNGSLAVQRSRGKLRAPQVLSREGIGTPPTSLAHPSTLVPEALEHAGRVPAVIEPVEGTQGLGVGVVGSERSARSVIEALRARKVGILVQAFTEEAGNSGVRTIVVGEEAVAAMRRTGAEGDFRSNLHRGGNARARALSEEEAQTAVRAVPRREASRVPLP